jgi:hypothetical protein
VTLTKRAKDQYAKKTSTWLAWAFTLPTAAVYKSLKFSVSGSTGVPQAMMGPQDFTACGTGGWGPGCVTRDKTLPFLPAWVTVTGSLTRDHCWRVARLNVWLDYQMGGVARLKYGKVAVKYGVLK